MKEKKRFKIFDVEFVYLYLFGIVVAFIGWIAENFAKLVTSGIIDSRFHLLPFISPYALIAFAFHIALKDPDNITIFGKQIFKEQTKKNKILSNIISATIICLFVFLGELVVGNMWEILFGVELWNYSNMPLSVTQYAGLIPTLGYGLGAYLIFKFMYIPFLNLLRNKVKFETAKIIDLTLGVLIVLDTLFMIFQIVVFKQAPLYWKITL